MMPFHVLHCRLSKKPSNVPTIPHIVHHTLAAKHLHRQHAVTVLLAALHCQYLYVVSASVTDVAS